MMIEEVRATIFTLEQRVAPVGRKTEKSAPE